MTAVLCLQDGKNSHLYKPMKFYSYFCTP